MSKRELLREKQYDAKRRRQWALALGVVILFIGIAAAALHFITNRPATTTNTAACTNANPGFTSTSSIINQVIQSSMASTLGITTSTLQSDLNGGESLADIAQAQNKQMSDVNTAYLNAVQNELNTLVSAGQMTRTRPASFTRKSKLTSTTANTRIFNQQALVASGASELAPLQQPLAKNMLEASPSKMSKSPEI